MGIEEENRQVASAFNLIALGDILEELNIHMKKPPNIREEKPKMVSGIKGTQT